ncbi:MAG: hypothetical protein K5657_04220 [Desulfovibrio sp.]|nr:hypothetical protein [Desulfovibrio sp.]
MSAHADTWAIYWYLCGSDLEERFQSASADIEEVMKAQFHDNVTVVVQTGGSKTWKRPEINPNKLQRFTIRNGKMTLVQTLPQGDMGDSGTLADFLEFCANNYDADHTVLIIWDHGGGGAGRFAVDGNFGNAMTVKDLRDALESVMEADAKVPPLDIIGFDACLMASLEVATACYGFSDYLVASQNIEPGVGWNYTAFLSALAANTDMAPEDLAKHICDSYLSGCKEAEEEDGVTLSVINLELLPKLKMYWDIYGLYSLSLVGNDRSQFGNIARHANEAENFYNIRGERYSNMVDIGDFVLRFLKDNPEDAAEFTEILKETVAYKVGGPHQNGSGLSFYHPIDGGNTYQTVLEQGNPTAFLMFQGLLTGRIKQEYAYSESQRIYNEVIEEEKRLKKEKEEERQEDEDEDEEDEDDDDTGSTGQSANETLMKNIAEMFASATTAAQTSFQPLEIPATRHLEDTPISLNEKGEIVMELKPEDIQSVSEIYGFLAIVSMKDELMIYLGSDALVAPDWKNGRFVERFRNRWPALDGNPLLLQHIHTQKDGYLYYVPIKVNGERVIMEILYEFSTKSYRILGVRSSLNNETPDKQLRQLKPGDTITTLMKAKYMNRKMDIKEINMKTFKFSEKSEVDEIDLGDGDYAMLFMMIDVQGRRNSSQVALISVKDGKMNKEILD